MGSSLKFARVLLGAALVVALLGVGLFFGRRLGEKTGELKAEAELMPVIEKVFPAPLAEIKILSGTVRGVYGGTINLEILDPNDYLPHADGSAPQKQIRYIGVTNVTKIALADIRKVDRGGKIVKTSIQLSDLRAGDMITAKSEENIKDAKSFEVTEIEVVRY